MLLHHAKPEQVAELELIFAKLTPSGWVIPDWVKLMMAHAKPKKPNFAERK